MLVVIGLRDHQRAEFLADDMGAKAAGSDSAVSLLDKIVTVDVFDTVVRREARNGNGPQRWRAEIAETYAGMAGRLPRLRQLTIRDNASVFASHPPSGLRVRLIESRPWQPPAVVVTEADVDRMDAELAKPYDRVRRDIAWTG